MEYLPLDLPALPPGTFLLIWGGLWLLPILISVRPSRRSWALIVPSFVTGWFISEAPLLHLLLLWLGAGLLLAQGALGETTGAWGLALCVLSSLGLLFHLRLALRVPLLVEAALREGLGEGYASRLPPDFDQHAGFPPFRLYLFLLLYDSRVRVFRNIPYVEGGGRRQQLDVYMPPGGPEGAPVVFQIHGGAWIAGHKSQQARPLMFMLAARGFVCVSVNYRLSPWARWPDHLIDVKQALAWTKDHIRDYGGDPSRVLVTGGSAGGQLAALLALTPNQPELQPGFEDVDTRVQAAVTFYAIYDVLDRHGVKPFKDLSNFFERVVARRPWRKNPELFDSASPMVHVGPDAPPMFVIHGTHDSLAPVEEARLFVDKLRQVSHSPVVYLELPYAHHMFETFYSLRALYVLRAVHVFAAVQLMGPGRKSPEAASLTAAC